jgi:hypothetical protein
MRKVLELIDDPKAPLVTRAVAAAGIYLLGHLSDEPHHPLIVATAVGAGWAAAEHVLPIKGLVGSIKAAKARAPLVVEYAPPGNSTTNPANAIITHVGTSAVIPPPAA